MYLNVFWQPVIDAFKIFDGKEKNKLLQLIFLLLIFTILSFFKISSHQPPPPFVHLLLSQECGTWRFEQIQLWCGNLPLVRFDWDDVDLIFRDFERELWFDVVSFDWILINSNVSSFDLIKIGEAKFDFSRDFTCFHFLLHGALLSVLLAQNWKMEHAFLKPNQHQVFLQRCV